MTKFQNSKPVYDLEERLSQFWKNQSDMNSKVQTCFGHSILKFGIYLACDELPSACSGPELVEGGRVEFGACILGFNSSL